MLFRGMMISMFLATSAFAQTIYAPVQTQFDGYYAPFDTAAIRRAARHPEGLGATWGRRDGFAFVGPHRVVHQRKPRVFLPGHCGIEVGHLGYTPNDVHNAAMAQVPTYFRKADLLASAVEVDGHREVPAHAPMRTGTVVVPRGGVFIRPVKAKSVRPVFVFPKQLLNRQLHEPPTADVR
jgi:hypothetical protein